MFRSRLPPIWMLFGAVVVTAPTVTERPAAAYVRKVTASGAPYKWSGSFPSLQVYLTGVPGLTPEAITQAVSAAAQSWTEPTCTSARIDLAFPDGDGPPTANDGVNVIAARSDGWCVDGEPTPPSGAATCNDPSAVAVTSVFAQGGSGRILGADTQLNTLTVVWAVLDDNGAPADAQDLQSVLTHELGHVLGLEHPCWSGVGARATDDQGQPVPDCYGAPVELEEDTMFPSYRPGDISRRALSADASRAICEIYPLTSGGGPPGGAGGCSVIGSAASDPGWADLALILGQILGVAGVGVMRPHRRPCRGRRRPAAA
jgi:hypothetical protein